MSDLLAYCTCHKEWMNRKKVGVKKCLNKPNLKDGGMCCLFLEKNLKHPFWERQKNRRKHDENKE